MASDSEPVLRAADLSVERGDSTVLDGLSVSVSAGERALIRGESGAGKTTLFEVLGLLLPPTDAEVGRPQHRLRVTGHRRNGGGLRA